MMNVFMQLKYQQAFSNNEKVLAQYILEHPTDVLNMNVKELGSACFVSDATIYRLCAKLGLNGFSELKIKMTSALQTYIREDQFDYDFPIKSHQTHYEIICRLKEDYEYTLQSTQNLFDLNELKKIMTAMTKAKQIDIYTSAGNVFFAENFKFQMAEIGVSVNVPIDEYYQRLLASSSDEDHLAIMISFGGRGLLTENIAELLKQAETPILLISSYEYHPKNNPPDYHLYISPYENHYKKISSYSTRLSILYILDVLYTCFFNLDYEKNIEKKLRFYQRMTAAANKVKE